MPFSRTGSGSPMQKTQLRPASRMYLEGSSSTRAEDAQVYLNDLWFFDPAADKWARAPTNGTKPPARDHLCGNQPLSGEIYDAPGVLFSRSYLNRSCSKLDEVEAEGCLSTRVEEIASKFVA